MFDRLVISGLAGCMFAIFLMFTFMAAGVPETVRSISVVVAGTFLVMYLTALIWRDEWELL